MELERRLFMEFLIGLLFGVFLCWVFSERKPASGEFIINLEDPNEETFKLNMYDDLNDLCFKDHIKLQVKVYGKIR